MMRKRINTGRSANRAMGYLVADGKKTVVAVGLIAIILMVVIILNQLMWW